MSTDYNKRFILFSKPFVDAIKDTFKVMMSTEVTVHSPKIKSTDKTSGDIAALIGMNGLYIQDEEEKDFKGLLVIAWSMSTYLNVASKLLMEEYTEFNDEIADTGAEISNIVMGNAKKILATNNYKIDMATPSTIKGTDLEIKYPPKTKIIETVISSDLGDFSMEICYQEIG
jgi:chemotaxis protein CheX